MDDQPDLFVDEKELLDEQVAEVAPEDREGLLPKLETAIEAYSPEGENPDPMMHKYVTSIRDQIVRARKANRRKAEMRRQKRKTAKQSRKRNRR